MTAKKRVIKDYDALPDEVKDRIKLAYPRGFAQHLLKYTDIKGNRVSALPFDTDEIYYLVRMTVSEAVQIIEEDEDYDDDGTLRDDFEIDDDSSDDEIFENVKEEDEEPNLLKDGDEEEED
jgi:DNA-directed RNA polymerase subunit delta